jgi:hypothetical protein
MNGQENDDEITGKHGSHTSAEYWEYDTRLGRRWNLDIINQVSISDYACFRNNPIVNADPNGAEATDTRLFDRKTGKQVGYHEDAMGKDYIVDDYGTLNKDGSFTHGTTVTPEDRQAVNNNANKIDKALAYSRNTSNSLNQFTKGLVIGAVAMPAAVAAAPVIAAEASLIYGFGSNVSLNIVSAGGSGYLANSLLRTSIDASAQMAVNNGDVKKLDVGDALMTGFLTPGASAVLGGAVDYRPFAQKPLMTVVNGKDVYEAIYDGSMKYAFSRNGYVGGPVNQLGKEFSKVGGSNIWPIMSAPYNAAAKKTSAELKKAIFSK